MRLAALPPGTAKSVDPGLRSYCPVPFYKVFEAGQLGRPNGAARMHFSCRDADLCPHPEFAPIGKLGRRVVHQDRTVEVTKELRGHRIILADHRVRVVGAVLANVRDSAVDPIDDFRRDDHVQKLKSEVFGRGGNNAFDACQ